MSTTYWQTFYQLRSSITTRTDGLVCRKVVDHDNILGFERRSETLFDIGQEFLSGLEPSIVCGALMPHRRRAATKVTVF